MALMIENFLGKLIFRFEEIEWLPRAPNLTPPDFHLQGNMKSKVYEEDPRILEELKCDIQEEITMIDEATLCKVKKSTLNRHSGMIGP